VRSKRKDCAEIAMMLAKQACITISKASGA
jgi:hypothetical protein